MRWLPLPLGLGLLLLLSPVARAAEGSILKVLPQLLDLKGKASLSPSLYDRDAYQALLRKTPSKRSTLRFAIQWKAKVPETEPLKIRIEMIGAAVTNAPRRLSLDFPVEQHHWFSHWAYLKLSEEQYQKLGEVTAWRVTLWDGDLLLSEQKSFLWQPDLNQ